MALRFFTEYSKTFFLDRSRVSNDEMFLSAPHGCSFQTSLQHLRQLVGVSHRVLRAVVGRRADPRIASCDSLPRL